MGLATSVAMNRVRCARSAKRLDDGTRHDRNLCATGLLITLAVGFGMLAIPLRYLSPDVRRSFMHGTENIGFMLRGFAP